MQVLGAIVQWDWLQGLRFCNGEQAGHSGEIRIDGGHRRRRQIGSRNESHGCVESIETRSAVVVDAVTGAQHGFAFSEPRKLPAQTHSRSKIVPIVFMYLEVGIWG